MTTWNRRRFLSAAIIFLPAGCAGFEPAPPDPRREAVGRLFSRLQQGLRTDRWEHIGWAFSPDFRDLPSVRNRWEDRWARRQTMEVELVPGRILESGGLLNVQVRWHRVLRDKTGQFTKASGTAEVILEPFRNEYRIRQVLGESFF
ncbi:MAG: hypothetical protein PHU46_06110 [Rhodocyclaceae bacterium]|nr:hypothetical protein [Rhodocyclaceae bacterium]